METGLRAQASVRQGDDTSPFTIPPEYRVDGLYFPVCLDDESYLNGQNGMEDGIPGTWEAKYRYHQTSEEGYAFSLHLGTDFFTTRSTAAYAPVFSSASGVVTYAGWVNDELGYVVVTKHVADHDITFSDGRVIVAGTEFFIRSLHMQELTVQTGDLIHGGEPIGRIRANPVEFGNSHLHQDISTVPEYEYSPSHWPDPASQKAYDDEGRFYDSFAMFEANDTLMPPYYFKPYSRDVFPVPAPPRQEQGITGTHYLPHIQLEASLPEGSPVRPGTISVEDESARQWML